MKVLGAVQISQIKHKYLEHDNEEFRGILGNVPRRFKAVVFGDSGNGKTEFCMLLARFLAEFDPVVWVSYEQGFQADFTEACDRNNMKDLSGQFKGIDPFLNLPEGVSLLEDLCGYLDGARSPKVVVIDSLDDTGWTKAEYNYLVKRYEGKKSFVFIVKSSKNGKVIKSVCEHARFHSQLAIWVRDYIAFPTNKNRFNAQKPFVVYEERARKLNPTFFAKEADK